MAPHILCMMELHATGENKGHLKYFGMACELPRSESHQYVWECMKKETETKGYYNSKELGEGSQEHQGERVRHKLLQRSLGIHAKVSSRGDCKDGRYAETVNPQYNVPAFNRF